GVWHLRERVGPRRGGDEHVAGVGGGGDGDGLAGVGGPGRGAVGDAFLVRGGPGSATEDVVCPRRSGWGDGDVAGVEPECRPARILVLPRLRLSLRSEDGYRARAVDDLCGNG